MATTIPQDEETRMLVLSRKKGEQIRIGDDIVVTVHRLSGNRVSLGIEAPPKERIIRGELKDTPPDAKTLLDGATEESVAPDSKPPATLPFTPQQPSAVPPASTHNKKHRRRHRI